MCHQVRVNSECHSTCLSSTAHQLHAFVQVEHHHVVCFWGHVAACDIIGHSPSILSLHVPSDAPFSHMPTTKCRSDIAIVREIYALIVQLQIHWCQSQQHWHELVNQYDMNGHM